MAVDASLSFAAVLGFLSQPQPQARWEVFSVGRIVRWAPTWPIGGGKHFVHALAGGADLCVAHLREDFAQNYVLATQRFDDGMHFPVSDPSCVRAVWQLQGCSREAVLGDDCAHRSQSRFCRWAL